MAVIVNGSSCSKAQPQLLNPGRRVHRTSFSLCQVHHAVLEKYAPIAYTTLSACDHLSFKKSAYGVLPIGAEAVNNREQKKRRTGRKRTLMPPPRHTPCFSGNKEQGKRERRSLLAREGGAAVSQRTEGCALQVTPR